MEIPIRLSLPAHFPIRRHPVKVGVPFPRGLIRNLNVLGLYAPAGDPVLCDLSETTRWPDESVRWALLRFVASGDSYVLRRGVALPHTGTQSLGVVQDANSIGFDTGAIRFTIPLKVFDLRSDAPALSLEPEILTDAEGRRHVFRVDSHEFEHLGKASAELLLRGRFVSGRRKVFCQGESRLSFWAGEPVVRLEFTLWNPRAAKHPGGLWDLGDPGSVFFRSVHLKFRLAVPSSSDWALSVNPGDEVVRSDTDSLSIHQSSSGGPNWRSLVHVDKDNVPTPKFRGYRLYRGLERMDGFRANPTVIVRDGHGQFSFALEDFWQSFPSRLEVGNGVASVEPFPAADLQDFELQGGEQATFRLWADFAVREGEEAVTLLQARAPVIAALSPEWYCSSGCFPHLVPDDASEDRFFKDLFASCLEGENSLFARRERFEEYGWRNFGEVAADHELLHFNDSREFVSHYNNQYDMVLGFLLRFAATGDPRWFDLGRDLARHVIDHDLYHTQEDKAAYNGGYFWHTAHYLHAGTSTHRTFSRRAREDDSLPPGFGGGPANEHNYSSGLLTYYFLTGDTRSRSAVLQLAGWVLGMQDPWLTPFRLLSRNPTGLATCTRELDFQGPGRGAAYSINTCLDAYQITADRRWLDLASNFIHLCIHPSVDPDKIDLLNREDRWSYVVFLQVLGRYLDLKHDEFEMDDHFDYARACLLAVAEWMARKEYPYLDRPDQLEYPTSTWAAHEIRKSCVFILAAQYGEPAQEDLFLNRARYFVAQCRDGLAGFPDRASARNLAITLANYNFAASLNDGELVCLDLDFKPAVSLSPAHLIPQKSDALRRARRVIWTGGLAILPEIAEYVRDRLVRR